MKDYSYEILDLLKKYDGDTEAALAGENSPQCLYAFSPLRENLFEWVELPENARVLQLGSDYGSYTGILAKKAGEVTVWDGRDENLEVNRRRHEGLGNVRYAKGELLKAGEPETFDAVFLTLGGVEKEKAGELLLAAARFLKEGGELFAAAENELGIRYWMGGTPVETIFLPTEFAALFEALKKESDGSLFLYYPVPDYRYPAAVYSDAYLPSPGELGRISARYDGPGVRLRSEEEAMARVCKNGDFPRFANSFLGVWRKAAKQKGSL